MVPLVKCSLPDSMLVSQGSIMALTLTSQLEIYSCYETQKGPALCGFSGLVLR